MMAYIRRVLAALLVLFTLTTALPVAAFSEEMQDLAVLTPEQLEALLGETEAEEPAAEPEEMPAILEELTEELPEADFAPVPEAAPELAAEPEAEISEPAQAPAEEEESEETGMADIICMLTEETLSDFAEAPQEEAVPASEGDECLAEAYSPVQSPSANAWDLADYAGLSVEELAEKLGLSVEAVLALTEEETALYQAELNRPLASGGAISLDIPFSTTVYTSSIANYTIKISRSGRYLLNASASKSILVEVYYGSTRVGNVGNFCGGNAGNWCVDLEAGKTYTFQISVDSRYSSGSCTFTGELSLYTDGSHKDRAAALAYDVYSPFTVKYSNDFRIFSFTAISGKKYRIHTKGSLSKTIEVCDSGFNVISTQKYKTGTHYFDVALTPGNTYYLKIHGKSYKNSTTDYYKTGSGEVKIECLDKLVNPISFTMSKKTVNPGTGDSIKFTIKSKYAQKVRLVLDGAIYGSEVKVSGGKATIKASFHDSGSHKIQVQGYYNNTWSLLSDPVSFTVSKKAALSKPSFSSVINNTGTDQDYVIHWYALDGADQYIVSVQSGEVVIYTATVDGTCVTIPGSVLGTPGMYVVDVYGIGKNVQQSEKPASAQVTVVDQKIILSLSSVLKGKVITWTAHAANASGTTQYRFDLYNSITGLVKQGGYTPVPMYSYTCTGSGEYYVIVYVKDGGNTVTGASESVKYVQPKAKTLAIQYNGKDAGKAMSVYLGKNVKLTAAITPEDARQDVTWKSSNSKIAQISADGTITPVKKGTVTITAVANDGSKKKDSITITVKRLVEKIEISGKTELASGMSTTLKATVSPADASKKTVKWTSSDPAVAAVNSEGVVTAAKGLTTRRRVTITAAAKDVSGVSASFIITVCPKVTSVQITRGGVDAGKTAEIDMSNGNVTLQLGKVIAPSNAIQTVKWTSSDKKIATVSENGLVTAIKPGKVTITATAADGSKKKDSITITVKCLVKSLSITGKSEIGSGDQTTLKVAYNPANATNKGVVWSSSDTSVASVNSKGVVTAKKVTSRTSATITAALKDGSVRASFKITVCPKASSVSISVGGVKAVKGAVNLGNSSPTLQLKANVAPADAAQVVTWTTSDKKIAVVSENGLVTGKKTGTATITAKAANGKKASFTVMVIQASPDNYFNYKVVNGAITITGYKGSSASVVIPKYIGVYPVEVIGANAFKNKTAITSLTLPSGLQKIESGAFYGCRSLLQISIPKNVSSIAANAFDGCASMEYKASAGTYGYKWGKENGWILEADSEKSLRSVLAKKAGASSFAKFYYDDYDGDGKYEAFALIGSGWSYDVWFVSTKNCIRLKSDIGVERSGKLGEEAPIIFTVEEGYGGSGSTSHAWVVNKGAAIKLKGNIEGLSKGEGNEFYIYPSYFDSWTDGTGHTWKPYYMYLSGNVLKEYGGIQITEKQLLKFDGAQEILNSIKASNITIKSIYYRANNIINISYVQRNGNTGYNFYITLRYDNDSVRKIDSGSGYYLKAHDTSIATYPKKFVNPS